MGERLDVAIVGAGPFGQSIAAHLRERRTRVFGAPMETWRTRMAPDMLLRSPWHGTSLSAPGGEGSLDEWARAVGEERAAPLPLQTFLRYSDWFRERWVPDSDPADVARLDRDGRDFRIVTTAGAQVTARTVVVAVGVTPFAFAPPPFAEALGDGVEFATGRLDFERYRGRRVVVVGSGQGGLESAALAARSGADVELLVRSKVRWFADREPHNPRGPVGRRLYALAYPAVGYGPPVLNRIVRRPDAFAALPPRVRTRLNRRLLRSGGSPWLRGLIEGRVAVTEGVSATALDRRDGALHLTLTDGTRREVDDVVLSTGFRFSMQSLRFVSEDVQANVALENGWPVLDRYFRSSQPGLLFVGFPAEYRFGPLSRFVSGTHFTAARVAAGLRE